MRKRSTKEKIKLDTAVVIVLIQIIGSIIIAVIDKLL